MDKNIENRIAKLEQYVKERERQQITFPLDNASITILNKYFLSITGQIISQGASGIEFTNIITKQGAIGAVIQVGFPFYDFTVDTGADTLAIGIDVVNGTQGAFSNGDAVILYSSGTAGTLPAPFTANTTYFVVNASGGGTTVQLALTAGGAAINITTTGTNQYYIQPLGFSL